MKFIVATIFIIAAAAVDAHPPAAAADANDNSVPATVVAATIATTTNDKQKKEDDAKPITEASAELSTAAASTTPTPTPTAAAAATKPDEAKTDEKLPVKIYFEGLCPDSRKLLSDLGREYYTFRKYITLDFVPFGRAKSLDADGNAFECHHGPKECVANRIHSCGIKYLTSQDAKQQFVVCQMRTEADQTGKECLEEAGGDWNEVSKCVDGDEGKKLQLIAENQTKEISQPRLENVPTIVFNNKYDSELNNTALKRLKTALCDMLSSKNIPDCA